MREKIFSRDGVILYQDDVLALYDEWESPITIISDGAYGLGLFRGDPKSHEGLNEWYKPHIAAWSHSATPQTTLWFWNSEVGWATVHPLLVQHGWTYVNCHIWNKGLSHIAGNANTKTLRKFPVVTEVCVQYVKDARINNQTLKDWLRTEWSKTGLPFALTNEACGVKNAATRKYFTKDHLWYFPPPDAFARLVHYANEHGNPNGKPYFSKDGIHPITAREWAHMRSKFHCRHGITNVWNEPPLNGVERIRETPTSKGKGVHLNQKPLKLMELIVEASTDEGDLVWEPFGGLCTAAIAAHKLGRRCLSAEIQPEYYELAVRRLQNVLGNPPERAAIQAAL